MIFLFAALATWRATYMLVYEDGPIEIIARFRWFVGVRHDEYSVAYGKNVIASALSCFYCTSVWIGAAVACLLNPVNISEFFILAFGLSALSIIIQDVRDKVQ